MNNEASLHIGFDPLCGWCFGAIPAIRHVQKHVPNLEIELLLGGLFTGEAIRLYNRLFDFKKSASVGLERVTGKRPSQRFFDVIAAPDAPMASSLEPCDAIRQVQDIAPHKALSFAHRLQEMHFEEGRDLNDPRVYAELTYELDVPEIETEYWSDRRHLQHVLTPSFATCRAYGITSFPSYVLETDQRYPVRCSYEGDELVKEIAYRTQV